MNICPKCKKKQYHEGVCKDCQINGLRAEIDFLVESMNNLENNYGLEHAVVWYVLKELGHTLDPKDTYQKMIDDGVFKKENEKDED